MNHFPKAEHSTDNTRYFTISRLLCHLTSQSGKDDFFEAHSLAPHTQMSSIIVSSIMPAIVGVSISMVAIGWIDGVNDSVR